MRIRVFKQPIVLQQMLLFRNVGMEYKQIAVLFNCDFSTIYHHCKKYDIKPIATFSISPYILSVISKKPEQEIITKLTEKPLIPIENLETQWYTDTNGERYNKGFDYKDYLRKHASKLPQ